MALDVWNTGVVFNLKMSTQTRLTNGSDGGHVSKEGQSLPSARCRGLVVFAFGLRSGTHLGYVHLWRQTNDAFQGKHKLEFPQEMQNSKSRVPHRQFRTMNCFAATEFLHELKH